MATAANSLTSFEREVLESWDGGQSVDDIAGRLGVDRARVSQVLAHYVAPTAEDLQAEAARIGSRRLANATAATGRRFT